MEKSFTNVLVERLILDAHALREGLPGGYCRAPVPTGSSRCEFAHKDLILIDTYVLCKPLIEPRSNPEDAR